MSIILKKKIKYLFQLKVIVPLRKFFRKGRSLPEFLVVGGHKTGTTSLFYYLRQHPDIVRPLRKEVHYFDDGKSLGGFNYSRGKEWYLAHFPKIKNKGQITFEVTPTYLNIPTAAQRIAKLLPHIKIIILIRNPVDRLVSHYKDNLRKGLETLSLEEALRNERYKQSTLKWGENHYLYKQAGLYGEHVQRYIDIFGINKVFIIRSEKFFENVTLHISKLQDFLGVVRFNSCEYKKIKNQSPNTQFILSDNLKYELTLFYKHDSNLLENILYKIPDKNKIV